jgi:hypothetical protein
MDCSEDELFEAAWVFLSRAREVLAAHENSEGQDTGPAKKSPPRGS